jgi:hypothetical protein
MCEVEMAASLAEQMCLCQKKIFLSLFRFGCSWLRGLVGRGPCRGRRSGDAPPKRTHGRVLDWASFVGRNEISLSVFFWTVFRF